MAASGRGGARRVRGIHALARTAPDRLRARELRRFARAAGGAGPRGLRKKSAEIPFAAFPALPEGDAPARRTPAPGCHARSDAHAHGAWLLARLSEIQSQRRRHRGVTGRIALADRRTARLAVRTGTQDRRTGIAEALEQTDRNTAGRSLKICKAALQRRGRCAVTFCAKDSVALSPQPSALGPPHSALILSVPRGRCSRRVRHTSASCRAALA